MNYVLILIMVTGVGHTTGVTVVKQEFQTKALCEKAANEIYSQRFAEFMHSLVSADCMRVK